MTGKKVFYDIHCHAINLGHANIIAFLRRMNLISLLTWTVVAFIIVPLIINLAASILFNGTIASNVLSLLNSLYFLLATIVIVVLIFIRYPKILNLLSVMENDAEHFFHIMEDDLKRGSSKNNSNNKPLWTGTALRIGEVSYEKVILTPLIMDFGYKNIKAKDIHYWKPPHKPVTQQVRDIFVGIKSYRDKSLIRDLKTQRLRYQSNPAPEQKLFEIYPFLGINPCLDEYGLEDIEKLLEKYFGKYTGLYSDFSKQYSLNPTERRIFPSDLDEDGDFCNFFAGIKLYPPLGFDPWPQDATKLEKVRYLYKFCEEKKIPLTIHCSEGGFRVIKDRTAKDYTSPDKWKEQILPEFRELKINFAHFGGSISEWEETILYLIENYKNVYTDFSYKGIDANYYVSLVKILEKHQHITRLKERILFGSDFMINLLDCDSYEGYLRTFSETQKIIQYKDLFCSQNPSRFLFLTD